MIKRELSGTHDLIMFSASSSAYILSQIVTPYKFSSLWILISSTCLSLANTIPSLHLQNSNHSSVILWILVPILCRLYVFYVFVLSFMQNFYNLLFNTLVVLTENCSYDTGSLAIFWRSGILHHLPQISQWLSRA